MTGAAGTAIGVVLLVAVLVWAVARPRRWPEAVVAVPAALLALVLGLVTPDAAAATMAEFGPTLAFLAAVLVLAGLADANGVFGWLGSLVARRSGSAVRMLAAVFVVAAATTAVLSLDATVVLLTPAVIAAVRRGRVHPDPPLYAVAHLSNSASLLLPVSNLTNLLAFHLTGLTFIAFAGAMALPFLACVLVEYVVFRLFFARELGRQPGTAARGVPSPTSAVAPEHPSATSAGLPSQPAPSPSRGSDAAGPRPPALPLVVLAAVLVGFALAPLAGVPVYLVAILGAVALAVPSLARGRMRIWQVAEAVNLPFLLFVASLLIVVDAAVGHGAASWLAARLPSGTSLAALAVLAGIGALLACVINNLPATLVLLAALGPHPAAAAVLAVLIGVNIGPNLTYSGSLSLLLWRRVLLRHALRPAIGRFTLLGVITVPLCLAAAVLTLHLVLGA